MTALLLAALLAIVPHSAATPCLRARFDAIAAQAAASSARYGVPPGVLLSVAFLESHAGCARGSGGCWGAPASARRRGVAGTSDHAARVLARGYALTGSWAGAVHFFRCGRTVCPRLVGYESPYAVGLIERVHARAGVPLPERLR